MWSVELVPTPATTLARPATASTTIRTSRDFSASVVVGDSPVVPLTTSASLPASTRWAASQAAPASSRAPSGWNGVIIAVIMRPNGAGGNTDIPVTLERTSDNRFSRPASIAAPTFHTHSSPLGAARTLARPHRPPRRPSWPCRAPATAARPDPAAPWQPDVPDVTAASNHRPTHPPPTDTPTTGRHS
ncbi:hypothetical protein FAGKG844_120013 [Frankia sp. AgKG'84/4]